MGNCHGTGTKQKTPKEKGSLTMDATLILRPTGKRGTKGEIYNVLLNGEVIATGASPECAACRVLKERGFTGSAYFWRDGGKSYDLKMPIAWASGRYVAEDKIGIRFAKWTEFAFGRDELEDAA